MSELKETEQVTTMHAQVKRPMLQDDSTTESDFPVEQAPKGPVKKGPRNSRRGHMGNGVPGRRDRFAISRF